MLTFVKIRRVGVEVFHADMLGMTELLVVAPFRNFENAHRIAQTICEVS